MLRFWVFHFLPKYHSVSQRFCPTENLIAQKYCNLMKRAVYRGFLNNKSYIWTIAPTEIFTLEDGTPPPNPSPTPAKTVHPISIKFGMDDYLVIELRAIRAIFDISSLSWDMGVGWLHPWIKKCQISKLRDEISKIALMARNSVTRWSSMPNLKLLG